VVRYGNSDETQSGLAGFEKAYLPDKALSRGGFAPASPRIWQIEDGWMGYAIKGRMLALVFECPTRDSAARFIEEALSRFDSLEATHE